MTKNKFENKSAPDSCLAKRRFVIILLATLSVFPLLTACNKNANDQISKQYKVMAVNGLRLRDKPGLKSKKLTLIPYMATVSLIDKNASKALNINGQQGQWYKIKYQEFEGYAFSAFLTEAVPPPENLAPANKKLAMLINYVSDRKIQRKADILNSNKNWNISHQVKAGSKLIYTINPFTDQECNIENQASCLNLIMSGNGQLYWSDLETASVGSYDASDKQFHFFSRTTTNEDPCHPVKTWHIFIFNSKKLETYSIQFSSELNCQKICPCQAEQNKKNWKLDIISGDITEVTPSLKKIYAQLPWTK